MGNVTARGCGYSAIFEEFPGRLEDACVLVEAVG